MITVSIMRRYVIRQADWKGESMFQRKEKAPKAQVHVVVDRNLCYYCGACVAVCPPDSIFLENAFLHIDEETCTLCERCTNMCPVHALSMVEKEPCDQPMMQ